MLQKLDIIQCPVKLLIEDEQAQMLQISFFCWHSFFWSTTYTELKISCLFSWLYCCTAQARHNDLHLLNSPHYIGCKEIVSLVSNLNLWYAITGFLPTTSSSNIIARKFAQFCKCSVIGGAVVSPMPVRAYLYMCVFPHYQLIPDQSYQELSRASFCLREQSYHLLQYCY